MAKNEAQIDLTASDSKLINVLSRGHDAVNKYGRNAINVFKRVNASMAAGWSRLGALGPLGAGFGVYKMTEDLLEFDAVLRKVGRTSGASAIDMAAFRKQIVDLISPGSGIPLIKGQFADMAEALNTTGVSMNVIRAILPQVGKGAVASQTDVKIYAETIGELMDKYKVAATDLPALQDQLNAAMKMEDVRKSPEAFLQSISSMSKTMQLLKTQGLGNVTPLMALQAQLTQFTGSAGEASGSIEALFNGLLRVSKNKDINSQLLGRGINFFNQGGGVKSIADLIPQFKKLADEAQRSGKSIEEVSMAIFGRPEAAKTLMMIAQKYGDIMHKQEELRRSSGSLARDFKSESDSMAAKLKLFQNQLDKFKVDHMASALKGLSHVLDALQAHPVVVKGILSVIGLMGISVAAGKVLDVFQKIYGVISLAGATRFVQGMAALGGGAGTVLSSEALAAIIMQQAGKNEAAGLRKWRTENPYDYARQQQVMSGQPMQNTVNLTVYVTPDQIKTDTADLNTRITVGRINRGEFGINH